MHGSGIVGQMRILAPDAVVVDLDRLPSHGREMAIMLRSSKSTRHTYRVCGRVAEKVARLRAELSDAVYTNWNSIAPAIALAITIPPQNPIRPTPHMERWSGSSLVRKLSIAASTQISILGGPEGFDH